MFIGEGETVARPESTEYRQKIVGFSKRSQNTASLSQEMRVSGGKVHGGKGGLPGDFSGCRLLI